MIDPNQDPLMMGGGDPAQGGPMGAPPMDPNAPMDPGMGDMDPGEVAALMGQDIAQQREMAHQMVDQAAEAELQRIVAMLMQGAQGAQTLDGSGAMAA